MENLLAMARERDSEDNQGPDRLWQVGLAYH